MPSAVPRSSRKFFFTQVILCLHTTPRSSRPLIAIFQVQKQTWNGSWNSQGHRMIQHRYWLKVLDIGLANNSCLKYQKNQNKKYVGLYQNEHSKNNQYWEPPCLVSEAGWPRLSDRPWDHKPLRRQSLSPGRGAASAPFTLPCLALSLTS